MLPFYSFSYNINFYLGVAVMAKKSKPKTIKAEKKGKENATKTVEDIKTNSMSKKLSDPLVIGLVVVIAAIIIALVFISIGDGVDTPTNQTITGNFTIDVMPGSEFIDPNKVTVYINTEFLCPYSGAASGWNEDVVLSLQNSMPEWEPAVPALKERDDINFIYRHLIIHGDDAQKAAEASECARDQGKFWEYHDVLFQNQDKTELDALKAYAEELGLDTAVFNECLDLGVKADIVLNDTAESVAVAQAAGQSVGTPTFVIDGKVILGAQPYSVIADEIEFAKSMKNEPEFEIIAIDNEDCWYCDTGDYLPALQEILPKASVREIQSTSQEAQDYVQELEISYLPAFVIDSPELENTHYYSTEESVRGIFRQEGNTYVVKEEIVEPLYDAIKQKYELLGIEKGDNKPQIDFFVMSYCPYGNLAEEAIEPVYQNLGDNAYFFPRYVIYSNYQTGYPDYCLDEENKYCSMHGIQELNQDVRELCVDKYMGIDDYFRFVLAMNDECGYNNADTCWKPVAESLGLDTTVIENCEADEAEELLDMQLTLNSVFGVSGSPTVLIEGIKYTGSRTPAGYQQALCTYYENVPEGCGLQLEDPSSVVEGQC
jgi:protein-disulfide isomerase